MEFIEKFKNYLLSGKDSASKATVKNYLADVKQFIRWIEATYKKSFAPSSVTIQTIHEFKTSKSEGLSASSVDRHISSLKKFFTFLKLNGDIAQSPFDQAQPSQEDVAKSDPWHLHDFKNYLYIYNASHLTIKNYIIDVKQFLSWAEEVLAVKENWRAAEKNVLNKIDNALVEEYKQRLLTQHVFSPSSINRKLSSLRKYLAWAGSQGHMAQFSNTNFQFANTNTSTQTGNELPASNQTANLVQSKKTYSKIPPIRLFQKLMRVGTLGFDLLIVNPIAHLFRHVEHGAWTIKGKPLFVKSSLELGKHVKRFIPHVRNISKEFYAPLSLSTSTFPWYKKMLHHLRYTRPNWYRKYHQLAIAHYFNWAILIIFATALGFGVYNSFFQKANPSLANLSIPSAPMRVLSFQGRLTDASNNPITTPSWIRFVIYNQQSASGSARLWEEVDKVSPDQDGIFSTLLGSDGASDGGTAALCNGNLAPSSPATGACGIPSTVFSQNNALWLGVTVEATAELAPREQLATVAYASNAETLQGLPPITATGSGTQNVVLVLNSSGNLAIGGSTTFQSTSGAFNLSGNTVAINTNAGSGGNIVLAPDGSGTIDLQGPVQTSTNNGPIASAPNALTIADIAAILATSSGQSALTINQNGTGPIISASASGNAKFTLQNDGTTILPKYNIADGVLVTANDTTGTITQTAQGAAHTFLRGNGAGIPTFNAVDLSTADVTNALTVDKGGLGANLSTGAAIGDLLYADSTTTFHRLADVASGSCLISGGTSTAPGWGTCPGSGSTNYWQLNGKVVSPADLNNDFAVGGNSTSSAAFQVFAESVGTTKAGTASTSAYLTFGDPAGTNPLVNILNGNSLIFKTSPGGDNGTGYTNALTIGPSGTLTSGKYTTDKGILFADSTGLFTQTAQGAANTVLHGNGSGVPTFSAVSLTADVTNTLPLNHGGTNGNLTANAGGIVWSDASQMQILAGTATAGQCLISGSNATPSWATCATGSSGTNYWQLNGKVVSPADLNNDFAVGGNSTSSAAFQVFAESVGTTKAGTASTSANFTFGDTAGTNPLVNILNGNSLIFKTSPGGDNGTGYTNALTIASGGSLTDAAYTIDQGILYTNTSGNIKQTAAPASSGLCLVSASSGNSPTWNNCATASSNYWQVNGKVLSPADLNNDLAVGGNSTSSAKFQVFAETVGIAKAGTASTSANFSFADAAGTNPLVNILNGNNLQFNVSPGGDGSTTAFAIGPNGNTTSVDLVPNANGTINLGSPTLYYKTVYAQSFSSPTGNGVSGFWTVTNNTNLYPTNTADDLLIGGTASNSAAFQVFAQTVAGNPGIAGTATTSGYLTFKDAAGTNPIINILNGNSLLFKVSPSGDSGTGYTTALTIAPNGNLTTIGTFTLPNSNTVTGVTNFAQFSNGISVGGGTALSIDSSGNATLNSLRLPIGGGLDGYWQLSSGATNYGVLSPSNVQNDLAIGGAATSSAAFQVYGQSFNNGARSIAAGTSTMSGAMVFRGVLGGNTSMLLDYINGSKLVFERSPGGDAGMATVLTLGNDGNVTVANNFTVSGNLAASLIPTSTAINLGSSASPYGTVFANNFSLPIGGGLDGYWQLSSGATNYGVLSPSNVQNDLAIGGAATSSAAFQVFGRSYVNDLGTVPAGTASTSGNFVFRGTVGSQTAFQTDILNGASLGFYVSPGGDKGITATSPSLFLAATGNVGIGTTNPLTSLQIAGSASESGNFSFYNSVNNTTHTVNYLNGGSINFQRSAGGDGTLSSTLFMDPAGNVGIGNTAPQGILDVSSQGSSFPSDLVLNQAAATNLVPNPSFEGATPLNGWSFIGAAQYSASQPATESALFGDEALKFYNPGPGGVGDSASSACIQVSGNTTYTASAYIYRVSGYTGNTSIDIQEYQTTSCGTLLVDGSNTMVLTTNAWTRAAITQTTNASTQSIKVRFVNDGNSVGRAYADGFQLEQASSTSILSSPSPYFDGSFGPGYSWTGTPNNSSSVRQGGSAFAYDSLNSANGIGAASRGTYPTLQLDQNGIGDIFTASASGTTQMTLTNTGNLLARKFTDLDNQNYFIDPAAAGINPSASVSGSLTFDGGGTHNVNLLSTGNLNIQRSVGGDTGLTSSLYVQGSTGNVGIGVSTPSASLEVSDQSDPTLTNIQQIIGKNSISIATNYSGNNYMPGIIWHTLDNNPTKTKAGIWVQETGSGTILSMGTTNAYGTGINNSALNIDYNGFVGLGNLPTAPRSYLTVNNSGLRASGKALEILDQYESSGDIFTASASGATKFVIQNNGNVGIGTATPVDPLQINANSEAVYVGDGTNTSADISVNGRSMFGWDGVNTVLQSGTGHGIRLNVNGTFSSGTTGIDILSDGNVGIGTTSPSDLLDISGNATESGNLSFRGTNTQHNVNILNGGQLAFNTSVGGTSTLNTALYIDNGNNATAGDVGINNASPSRNLDVIGSQGGNNVDTEISNSAGGSQSITTPALSYGINYADTNTTGSQTETVNITGEPQVDGTWFAVTMRFSSSGGTVTLNLQVNGQTMHTLTGTGPTRASAIFMYQTFAGGSGWEAVGAKTTNSAGFDLAEYMPSGQQSPIPGSILTNSTSTNSLQIEESNQEYDQKAVGIVTTNPNIIFGDNNGQAPAGQSGIALSGRVPAIVTSLDGPLAKGDSITTSPILGTGMKPLRPTQTVGKALEPFDPATMTCTPVSSYNAIVWPTDDGSNAAHPCFAVPVSSFNNATQSILENEYHLKLSDNIYIGKVLVLVGNGYVDPDIYLTTTGDMNIATTSPSADFTIPTYYTLDDALNHPVSRMSAFLELAVGNLRAGSVQAQQIITNSLAVTTANVSIGGQSLHDYIAGVVSEVLNTQLTTVHSPIADNEIQTNLISPLASNSAIAIRLNNSRIEIAKDATGAAVASIDNSGNATFSGALNAQNLAVNGDATVSGTLHANNIEANNISGLAAVVGTLSAQNITNVTNIYFATPSAAPLDGNIATGFTSGSSSPSGLLNTSYASIASYSAYFAYVPNLKATTGMFDQGLVALGPTSLADTSITGQLAIGNQMILADTSLNVLGADFAIQPLRQGGVSFEGGLLAINTNGDLTLNGNAIFNKNVALNTLSPLPGHNLQINLQNGAASGSAEPSLNINNASGSAIFAVNQLGDLVASGAANIGKLNFNLVQPALAISDTEVVATGSAGTAAIKPYQREVTIDNPTVTSNSLIYITPVGTNQTPYLERQVSGKSFTVGIPIAQPNETNFNWLIVN